MYSTPLVRIFINATDAVIDFTKKTRFPSCWKLKINVDIDEKNRPVNVYSSAYGDSRVCVKTYTDLVYTGPGTIAAIVDNGIASEFFLDDSERDIVQKIIQAVPVLSAKDCLKLPESIDQDFDRFIADVWNVLDDMTKNGGPSFRLSAVFKASQESVQYYFAVYTKK